MQGMPTLSARLRITNLSAPVLTTFYRGTVESILTNRFTAWYGNYSTTDWKSLQRVMKAA